MIFLLGIRMDFHLGNVGGGPEPNFEKDHLHGLHRWTSDAQVCVAPGTEAGVAAEIVVTDVQSTDECVFAINDDNFAVVAEINLQTGPPVAVGPERAALDAGFTHLAKVRGGKFVGADFVEEKMNPDACLGPGHEGVFERGAESVVHDDEEVDEDVVLRLLQRFEQGVESSLAIDEDLDVIAVDLREAAETFGGFHQRGGVLDLVFEEGGAQVHGVLDETFIVGSPGADIASEFVSTKDPVERNSDVRHRGEGDDPCDGALRGAPIHDDVNGMQNTDDVHKQQPEGGWQGNGFCWRHPETISAKVGKVRRKEVRSAGYGVIVDGLDGGRGRAAPGTACGKTPQPQLGGCHRELVG